METEIVKTQRVFNKLLPYIDLYSIQICDEFIKYFDNNIILKDVSGKPLSKKLIGFVIKRGDSSYDNKNLYINDKYRTIDNKEHFNTLIYFNNNERRWSPFKGSINHEEWNNFLNFIDISLIRMIKINELLKNYDI
jgi:hypothetical protein